MPDKKPWAELSSTEKQEQIALRKGWIRQTILGMWVMPPGEPRRGGQQAMTRNLPNWPTNDDLAFTKVWPGIIEIDPDARIELCSYGKSVYLPRRDPFMPRNICGTTWADAICHARYELLENGDTPETR